MKAIALVRQLAGGRWGKFGAAVVVAAMIYGVYWKFKPVPVPQSLHAVSTPGSAPVYLAPQVKAISKIAAGKKHTVIRPIKTFPTRVLPKQEQDRIPEPAELPPVDAPVKKPELADTAVCPPNRGVTEVRSYVMPDGAVTTTIEPKREAFFGFPVKHLELEAKYEFMGEERIEMTARWLPVRVGNFHLGIEGDISSKRGDKVEAKALGVLRWEPWR